MGIKRYEGEPWEEGDADGPGRGNRCEMGPVAVPRGW